MSFVAPGTGETRRTPPRNRFGYSSCFGRSTWTGSREGFFAARWTAGTPSTSRSSTARTAPGGADGRPEPVRRARARVPGIRLRQLPPREDRGCITATRLRCAIDYLRYFEPEFAERGRSCASGPQPSAVVRAVPGRARALPARLPAPSDGSLSCARSSGGCRSREQSLDDDPGVRARRRRRLAADRDRLAAGRPPAGGGPARDPDRARGRELGQPDDQGRDPRRPGHDDRLERGPGPGGRSSFMACPPRASSPPARTATITGSPGQPSTEARGVRAQGRARTPSTRSCSTSARRGSSPATTRSSSCASGFERLGDERRPGARVARRPRPPPPAELPAAGVTPISRSPDGSSSGRAAALRRPTAEQGGLLRFALPREGGRRDQHQRPGRQRDRPPAGVHDGLREQFRRRRRERCTSPIWRGTKEAACSTSPSRGTSTSSSSAPRCAPRRPSRADRRLPAGVHPPAWPGPPRRPAGAGRDRRRRRIREGARARGGPVRWMVGAERRARDLTWRSTASPRELRPRALRWRLQARRSRARQRASSAVSARTGAGASPQVKQERAARSRRRAKRGLKQAKSGERAAARESRPRRPSRAGEPRPDAKAARTRGRAGPRDRRV